MNKSNITAYIAGIVLTLSLYVMTAPASVDAQERSALPLRVSPARQEIAVDPGDTTAVNVNFFNLADFPTTGYVRVADFIVNGTNGTPRILDDTDQVSPRFSAASWFDFGNDIMSVAPNDRVSLQITLNVPENARPGGRYVAVYFEPSGKLDPEVQASDQEAGAVISQRIASLVYIRVNGPITEKAMVSRMFAPTFLEYGPIDVEADVLNKGDYHIRPQGSFTLKNMAGGFVDQKKLEGLNIFPDSLRTFTETLGREWMMGKYTVEFVAGYGTTGQAITRSVDVWVFPWKVALAVILALVILYIAGRHIYRRLIVRENMLESEIRKEHEEIKKLKEELDRKNS